MRISNGNFLDEDGNAVNLVELLRTGKATPVVNNNDGHHMSAHSGWFTDENGTPVNIVALIDAAIDEDEEDGSDEPAIGGISVNGGNVVTPDENGIINLTISGDGSTVIDSELSASSTNPVQNKVVTGAIEDLNDEFINAFPTDIVSGEVASFSDGADDLPVKNLTVNIDTVQDLHGYENPWPAGGGINIWDEEWELGSYNNANGEPATYTDRIRSKNRISVVPNTEYFFKTSNGLTVGNVYFYDVNDVFISARTTIGNTAIVTPDNCSYMRIALGLPYGATYNNDVSINYPSTNTDYYPYSNVCPISGWSGAKVTRTGKNLFDESKLLLASGWTVTNGVYSGSNSALHTAFLGGLPDLKFKPNTQYTVSLKFRSGQESKLTVLSIVYTDGTKTGQYLQGTSEHTVSLTSTSGKSVEKITLSYGNTDTVYIYDMQVEEGSTATDYEPYKGQSYAVDWTNEAGEVFGGMLNVTTGELIVDRVSFDGGDINWTKVDDYNYGNFYSPNLNPLPKYSVSVPTVFSSIYRSAATSSGTSGDAYAWIRSVYTGLRRIYIKDTSKANMTVEEFKTSLTGVDFVYILDTPIVYQLTSNEVKTILGENNIFADTGDVSVEYCADIKKYIDKVVATAVSALS